MFFLFDIQQIFVTQLCGKTYKMSAWKITVKSSSPDESSPVSSSSCAIWSFVNVKGQFDGKTRRNDRRLNTSLKIYNLWNCIWKKKILMDNSNWTKLLDKPDGIQHMNSKTYSLDPGSHKQNRYSLKQLQIYCDVICFVYNFSFVALCYSVEQWHLEVIARDFNFLIERQLKVGIWPGKCDNLYMIFLSSFFKFNNSNIWSRKQSN